MTTRTRNLPGSPIEGFYEDFFGRFSSHTAVLSNDYCQDIVAPGDGFGLTIEHVKVDGSCTGSQQIGTPGHSSYKKVSNFTLGIVRSPSFAPTFAPFLGVAGEPTASQAATMLLARTTPSRPDVDIPALFGEFMDFPMLVRKAGHGLINKIADGNLRYQFGIRPLLKDATTLLDFTDSVEKRLRELRALKKSGLRRTRTLWTGGATSSASGVFLNSSPGQVIVRGNHLVECSYVVRGFVRYYASGDLPSTDLGQLKMARSAVLGLGAGNLLASSWEVIPWSWLIDWFGNIGEYLNAHRNSVPCTPGVPQIMRHKKSTASYTITQSNDFPAAWPVGSAVRCWRETKTRQAQSASISARLPFISAGQMSILGSLAVLKGKRGRY